MATIWDMNKEAPTVIATDRCDDLMIRWKSKNQFSITIQDHEVAFTVKEAKRFYEQLKDRFELDSRLNR